jgi:hypothetical protein
MTLKDLLLSFKRMNETTEDMVHFYRKHSGPLHSSLLNASIKKQINYILSSHVYKNAFIDLIIDKKIPQAIIDHQKGTILPFDQNSEYPNDNGQKYTIILNMKYVVENELINHETCPTSESFTTKFNHLLKNFGYFKYGFYSDRNSNLIRVVSNYIIRKMWNGKYDANKLKEECKELFYSDLDKNIYSLDEPEDGSASKDSSYIFEDTSGFLDYVASLGIEILDTSNYKEIRTAVRQHIDMELDDFVEALRNYTYNDIFKHEKVFNINLLTNHFWLFSIPRVNNFSSKKVTFKKGANVDYYYQNEKYVNSRICSVNMVGPMRASSRTTINTINGSFPKVTELPNSFGAELRLTMRSKFKLPDFPNVTTIGENALSNLRADSLEFGKMDKLTTIGSDFCQSLYANRIDLRGLKNVITVGDNFLYNVTAKTILLPPFSLLEDSGNSYFRDRETKVNESRLKAITEFYTE